MTGKALPTQSTGIDPRVRAAATIKPRPGGRRQREIDLLAALVPGTRTTRDLMDVIREVAADDLENQLYVGWDLESLRLALREMETHGWVTTRKEGGRLHWTITDAGRREEAR